MSPRPSLIPEPDTPTTDSQLSLTGSSSQSFIQQHHNQQQQQQQNRNSGQNNDPTKSPNRSGSCRVCRKSFKPDDFSKTCFECHQRVCDDCAMYSKLDENEDAVS